MAGRSGSHEALFTSPTIHFTFTTHAGKQLDLERAVRRLLHADVATAAAWPSESGVRLTPQLRSLAKVIRSGERLHDDVSALQTSKSFTAAAKFAVRHPRLIAETLRHSPVAVDEDASVKSEAGTDASPGDSLEAALDVGRKVIVDAQVIAAVERRIDENLFGGSSRADDEFVRLTLRGSYHDLRVPQSDETEHVVFEPRLLLHKSGVVQLTVALPIHQDLTTSQLVELSRSDRAVMVHSEIPEPLLTGLPSRQLLGQWHGELDAGARLRVMDFPDPPTMADSLEQHLGAIGAVIGARLPREWNTYATVIATNGSCCRSDEKWQARHGDAVARVVSRYSADGDVDLDHLTGVNLSVSADHRLYANLGSATRLQVDGRVLEPIQHLQTVLIIEHALLQYFRLRILESDATAGVLYSKALERTYAEAIGVFADMRQHEIRFGSARQIARHLLADLGGEDMRRTIEAALNLSSQANATRASAVQSRRSMRLTWIATILAALVAVPVLQDLLSYVSTVDASKPLGFFLAPLRWASATGGWGPWLVLASLAGIAFVVWSLDRALQLPALVRGSTARFRRRRSWLPANLEVAVENTDDEANNEREV